MTVKELIAQLQRMPGEYEARMAVHLVEEVMVDAEVIELSRVDENGTVWLEGYEREF